MLGIRTSWKRSRISKIIAVIIPLPLLLLSFLLGAVEVRADENTPSSPSNITFTNANGVLVGSPLYSIRWIPESILDENNQWYNLDLVNGDYELSTAPTSGDLTIKYRGNLSALFRFSCDAFNSLSTVTGTLQNYITCSFSMGTPSYGTISYIRVLCTDIDDSSSFGASLASRVSVQNNNGFTIQSQGRYMNESISSDNFDVMYNLDIECVVCVSGVSESNYNRQTRELQLH